MEYDNDDCYFDAVDIDTDTADFDAYVDEAMQRASLRENKKERRMKRFKDSGTKPVGQRSSNKRNKKSNRRKWQR